MAATTSPLLDAARAWYDAGFCVIPSHEDGSKRPFGRWKQYQRDRPDWAALQGWLDSGRYTGIGLIMGTASGNAEMIEIEGPSSVIAERVQQLFDAAKALDVSGDLGFEQLIERIYHGCAELSAGGGLHIFVRVTDGPVPGNQKLAATHDKVIAETRGEGGFVIAWPTPARTGHDHNSTYLLLPDRQPADTAPVTADELEWVHAVFHDAFGGLPKTETPAPEPRTTTPTPTHDGLSPFDDYRTRTTWRDILEPAGWTYSHKDADHDYWVRPGKDPRDGHSASTIEDGPLYLFSTSVAGMPTEVGLSKAQVYAHLHHHGDLSTATRALREQGYGDELAPLPELGQFIINAATHDQDDVERTSWWPRDLTGVLAGHETEPDPSHLHRDDGPALFYASRVNGLIGESESGKTWVALHATQQELAAGRPVIYLDFEDSATGIINRLRTIGCEDEHLANLTYIAPDETLSTPAKRDLGETLANASASLVILDGFNAAMTLMGLDINSNNDATQFAQQLLKPIAATGACVIYVDHVPKSREARGKGGIGAQAKRAMTTGCALTVTVTEPFGQGQAGRLRLTVDKDRPGRVRAKSYAAKHAGEVILTPHGSSLLIHIQPSDGKIERIAEGTQVQKDILSCVKDNPNIARENIVKAVGGKALSVRAAIDHLEHAGNLQELKHGNARKYLWVADLDDDDLNELSEFPVGY